MRARHALAVLAFAVASPLSTARAQDPSQAAAQARFNEGVTAYERRDFERARLLFLQSVALEPRGSALRNLGLCEIQLGRPVDALHHLRGALRMPDLDSARKSVTQNDLREAYAATGHLVIETTDGATLAVDGQPIEGAAPFKEPIDVMPGAHVLEAKAGEQKSLATIDARAGVLVVASLRIEGAGANASGTAPFLAPAPLSDTLLSAGPAPESTAPPFWNARRSVGLGLVAVGIASAAIGVYFYTQAVDAQNRGDAARATLQPSSCTGASQPANCAIASDARSSQHDDAVLNYVFLGAGGAAAIVGATLFLWPSPRSITVAPSVGATSAGLRLQGEF
jgi:tetratricopeptide (TPR) repeat protein